VLSQALPAGLALAILLFTGAVSVADAPRVVRLAFERQEGATGCPEETAIRAGVAARLGYEPFREKAADLVRVSIRPAGRGLEARIELVDGRGQVQATRRLTSRDRGCGELASSVELAVAIAVDPMGSPMGPPMGPHPSGEAAVSRPRPGAASPPAAAVASAPPSRPADEGPPLSWRAQVGLIGGWGSAPSLGVGLTFGGALEGQGWSVGLEGRADLPASKSLRAGEASAGLLVASLVPCLRFGVASACVLATGGARQVAGDGLESARHATAAYLAFGGRLAAALPISRKLALALHGDVTAPVTRIRLEVDDDVVWTSPTLVVALGLGLAVVLP